MQDHYRDYLNTRANEYPRPVMTDTLFSNKSKGKRTQEEEEQQAQGFLKKELHRRIRHSHVKGYMAFLTSHHIDEKYRLSQLEGDKAHDEQLAYIE